MKPGRAVHGYTLVELVVIMAIFAVVMSLISISFGNIVRSASQLGKRVETDIGGLIGLELMRTDVELAGFGLPLSGTKELNYVEAPESMQLVTSCRDGCPNAKAYHYNDKPDFEGPSAYRVGNNVGFNGSDYLVLKSTAVGDSDICRRWCYLEYNAVLRPSRMEPEVKSDSKVRAIVLKTGATASGRQTRELVTGSSGSFSLILKDSDALKPFAPKDITETHLVYGVAVPATEGVGLTFPFNRADYYINRGDDITARCNQATGTLYKAVINHRTEPLKGSKPTSYPILDCAADMQVVLYMDTDDDGKVDYHPDPDDAVFDEEYLRKQLKEIRVYILAQQGKKDSAYQYPVLDSAQAIVVGDPEVVEKGLGHVWSESALRDTFGSDWRNYHWKIYTIVVQPKNL